MLSRNSPVRSFLLNKHQLPHSRDKKSATPNGPGSQLLGSTYSLLPAFFEARYRLRTYEIPRGLWYRPHVDELLMKVKQDGTYRHVVTCGSL
jgi:hypothetical protein